MWGEKTVTIKHRIRSIIEQQQLARAAVITLQWVCFGSYQINNKRSSHCLFAQTHISRFPNVQATLVVISILYSCAHRHYQYLIPTETTAQLVRQTHMWLCRVWNSSSFSVEFLSIHFKYDSNLVLFRYSLHWFVPSKRLKKLDSAVCDMNGFFTTTSL